MKSLFCHAASPHEIATTELQYALTVAGVLEEIDFPVISKD